MPTATATRTADQARDAIHRALPGPKGDQWSTARAVAEVVDMGYSTVTEHLRAMVEAGTVATTKQGRSSVFRKNGPSSKLRASDTVTRRAAGQTKRAPRNQTPAEMETQARADGAQAAEDIATGQAYSNTTVCSRSMIAGVTLALADVPIGCAPCQRCYPAYGAPPPAAYEPDSGYLVWMSTKRKGLDYHEPSSLPPAGPAPVIPVAAAPESAAAAAKPGAVPQPPPAARTPSGGGVGDTVAFLESVRPVSAAPAAPEARTPRAPKADRPPFAVWGRGELQVAILDHLRANDEVDGWLTPVEVAKALNSHAGAVAYGLDRLVVKGEVKKAAGSPMRYAAA